MYGVPGGLAPPLRAVWPTWSPNTSIAQIEAGVDAVQVFDSWVGALNARDYREFILPHTRRIFDALAALDVPTIHFGVGTGAILAELREAGGDVIGADWRTPLDEAWERIGFDRAIQGNLDPTLLLGPIDRVLAGADDVLERAGGRPGHIFNLGHGILPSDAGRARPGARDSHADVSVRDGNDYDRRLMMTGVLLMAHGTPSSMDEMPEYLRLVRGGRPPSPELVAEMRHNYEAIGGRSPLTDLTLAQGDALAGGSATDVPVAVGMRNWNPFIKDAIDELAARGRDSHHRHSARAAVLDAERHRSTSTRPPQALPAGISLDPIHSFHDHPLLLDAFAERLRDAEPAADEEVVFTAHSLPARVDRGRRSVRRTRSRPRPRGVAARCGRRALPRRLPERRPHARAVDRPGPGRSSSASARRAASGDSSSCRSGFVCDHTEILFDIDVQAKAPADAVGRGAATHRIAEHSADVHRQLLEIARPRQKL